MLSEVPPGGPVTSDEHLPMLIERLERIAANVALSQSITAEARRLAKGAKTCRASLVAAGGSSWSVFAISR
jgi:hypothetical protein